jgi:hypothetical protein
MAAKLMKYLVCAVIFLCVFFPQYPKRLFYPALYGVQTNEKAFVSATGNYGKAEDTKEFSYTVKKYTAFLQPVEKYEISGRTILVDRYDTLFEKFAFGHDKSRMLYSTISPADIGLANGKMAMPERFAACKFSHEYRLLKTDCNPAPDMMELNNFHIIPATQNVRKALDIILPNDIVKLVGILVDVTSSDVENFSLTTGRKSGDIHKKQFAGGQYTNMCLILYTTQINVNNIIYK